MEQEVTDEQDAIDAGLEDYLEIPSEEIEEEEYDFEEDELDIFYDVDTIDDDLIEEVEMFSPLDSKRLTSLKSGNDSLSTYLKHQQGIGGFNQIMSGNISSQVLSNMRNNLPNNLRNTPENQLKEVFLGYWRNKLGNAKINASSEQIQAITKAAIESGEDPDTWLRIAQVESNFKSNAVSPSGKHKGFFQVHNSYVNNPALLNDPYYATKIAIRHNKNQFKEGKLDYQLGGMPLSSNGFTPSGTIPYSQNVFGKYSYNNDLPQSTGFNPVSSIDPTGASQTISAIDKAGAGFVDTISTGIDAYKQVKNFIGQSVDSGVTSLQSILSERQNQKEYYDMIKKLYSDEDYNESPLTTLIKPKQAFYQNGGI